MAAMLHARNNTILFLWDKMFTLMQNIFIVPAMQHAAMQNLYIWGYQWGGGGGGLPLTVKIMAFDG